MATNDTEHRPVAVPHALDGLANTQRLGREGSWTPDGSSDMSDVDGATQLRPTSKMYAAGNQSGNTTAIPSETSEDEPFDDKEDSSRLRKKRKSIQVLIDDSGRETQHSLTAEDFREIMRSGMQKEVEKLSGKSKTRLRDMVLTRQFTTFDRQNPSASQSPFHGFFTLFWIAMALLLARIAAWNYKTQGSVFGSAEILHLMVDRDLFVLLATDAAMCAATSFGFFLHKSIARGYLSWGGSGWIIQSVWQTFFTGFVIFWTFWREWPWTHTVFIVLHVFVLLMKQHAYSFYNGYREFMTLSSRPSTNRDSITRVPQA